MPLRFKLTLKAPGCDEVTVPGEFTDSERSVLVQYLDQCDWLAQSKPMRDDFPCKMTVKFEQDSGMRVETTLPDNDTLSILLHRLRPLILENELANYLKVSAIVGQRVNDAHVRQLLKEQRMLYDGRQFQQTMRIKSNDIIVNSERVLSDWLNSHEYHRDPDKRETVDALFSAMPDEFIRGVLIWMLVDKINAIRKLASLVALMLGKSKSLTFEVHDQGDSAGTSLTLA